MEQQLKQSSPFGLFLRSVSAFWQRSTTRRKPSVWLRAMLTVAISSMLLATGALATPKETVTYIHSDISGSPLAATDAAGNVLWKESYFAYGQKTEGQPESEAQSQWFHGKEQDADTTMQYFGARHYDPGIGRFLGIDPVDYQDGNLHSFNRYAYGNNNPTKYLDPDGRIAFLIPFALTATAHAARTVALRFAVTATVNASRVGIVAGEIAAGEALGGAALASGVVATGVSTAKSFSKAGRSGKQARLRELASDEKLASADRGWIQQEMNAIERGQRTSIRNPPGKDLANERGREAAKGYDYSHSNLQDRDLHRLQHKYDDFGRANSERPVP